MSTTRIGGDATSPSWRVVGASVQGASHRQSDTPCQDTHASHILADGVLIAAVADGAGSAAQAEVGARIAASAAIDVMRFRYQNGPTRIFESAEADLRHAVHAAAAQIEAEAAVRGVERRELATTLIAVLAAPAGVVVAQVGDGAVVVQQENGELHMVTPVGPTREYINETAFLTSPAMASQMRIGTWNGRPRGVALLTDGLEMLALRRRENTPHPAFFEPLFRFAADVDPESASEQLAAFLGGPRVSARAADDLTLLLGVLS